MYRWRRHRLLTGMTAPQPYSVPASDIHYDAIVYGSGAAGLTCALTLAQQGAKVALLEKNAHVGGYAHGDGEQGFYWDHGGHILLAYRLGMQPREVFERLGISRRIPMVPDRQDFQCIFPDQRMELPADLTVAAEVLGDRFPHERRGIAAVFLAMEQMVVDLDKVVPSFRVADRPGRGKAIDRLLVQFQRPWLSDALNPIAQKLHFPGHTLLKYQNKTLTELLDEHMTDPLAKAYVSQLCVGIGTPPGRLSAAIAGVFLTHALRTMWMPQGGFGALAEMLRTMYLEAGGVVVTEAEVKKVTIRGGRARGVETKDGRRFTASAVVCASDARRLYLEQLPKAVVPATLRQRLPLLPTTPSFFQVQLGIDLDLTPYRDQIKRLNFIYDGHDLDEALAQFPAGNVEKAAYYLYVATFHQPDLAPPGMHSIKLECPTTLVSGDIDWERDKEWIADEFIRRTEAVIPNLREHIVVRRVRTPLDMVRDTGNSDGAFAGWALVPQMLSKQRPPQRTVVPGLYAAGQWTTPNAGLPWVMVSGYNTAGMVLRDTMGREEWQEYAAPVTPSAAAEPASAAPAHTSSPAYAA